MWRLISRCAMYPHHLLFRASPLEAFDGIIQDARNLTYGTAEAAVVGQGLREQQMVEHLNQSVKAKLVRHKIGNNRARRLAWLRNKGKVVKLHKKFREGCECFYACHCHEYAVSLDYVRPLRVLRADIQQSICQSRGGLTQCSESTSLTH